MIELKPCPFCPDGGKPVKHVGPIATTVWCDECGASIVYSYPEKAVEAWNSRYEPTCEFIYDEDSRIFISSCCGMFLGYFENDLWQHCPKCGKKVTKELKPDDSYDIWEGILSNEY